MRKAAIIWTIVGAIVLLGIITLASCLTFIESYELGYKFDTRTGETTIINRTGYVIEPPIIVRVHTIDTRPVQVCINANSRVLNCKLVRFKFKKPDGSFNKEGFDLFISWHGRDDYYTDGASANLKEILRSYAYDGSKDIEKCYPFIEIMKELKPESDHEITKNITADTTSQVR